MNRKNIQFLSLGLVFASLLSISNVRAQDEASLLFFEDNGVLSGTEYVAPDVGVIVTGGFSRQSRLGSNDGSIGAVSDDGVSTAAGSLALKMRRNGEIVLINITNAHVTNSLDLEAIHFDYARFSGRAPATITVNYQEGDIVSAPSSKVIEVTAKQSTANRVGDWDDYSVAMGEIIDSTVLAPGESATFRIRVSNGSPKTAAFIDNIGVTGTFVEPLENLFTIDTSSTQWKISPFLMGLHQVYSNARDDQYRPDAIKEEGQPLSMAEWARKAGIGTSRFPGGTVIKYWDWENPTGHLSKQDTWDPNWDPNNQVDESVWMSLDEYLDFAEDSGIVPMLGVNMYSGKRFDREADGIARAVRMVEYVRDRGYTGVFWYLGNEEAHLHGGIAPYARTFRKYAEAMKAVDPDLVALWNHNGATPSAIRTFLANDGGTSDGLETHGKWPYGGKFKAGRDPVFEVADWQASFPLRHERKDLRVYRDVAHEYRAAAASAGREDYLITNNEWGLGGGQQMVGFSRYHNGLVLTEYLMELIIGKWDSACLWDTRQGRFGGLVDRTEGYELNPAAFGMDMLADSGGTDFLHTIQNEEGTIHGYAATKNDAVVVYLLNKGNEEVEIGIRVDGLSLENGRGKTMVETDKNFGTIDEFAVTNTAGFFPITLPALSFTEVVFADLDRLEQIELLKDILGGNQ